ncbi:MAG: Rieske (2Fe-2S) protein [Gemmatimonadaceae bacterium]|nr:Rieske (2Fe-2S) protein [Gemmatimonadaceae bacterium]
MPDRHIAVPVAALGNDAPCPRRLDRRVFLRDTALLVVAALAAQGFTPDRAFADNTGDIEPLAAVGRTRTFALPTADGVWVNDADRVVLVRSRGKVYAFSIECPHRGRALEWQPDGQQFYCPKHKARFSPVGANIGGRRTTALDRFAIRREGAVLVIALDRVLSATDAPAEWNAAVVTV